MLKKEIKKIVESAVAECYPNCAAVNVIVDEPSSEIGADISCNAAFSLAKEVGTSPAEIAERLAQNLSKNEMIQSVEIAKNGFINFMIRDSVIAEKVSKIFEKNKNKLAEKSKILIEFVSANPTGPLHIGHGRGAALGDSLSRIYRALGYNVQTEYYINDVGVQMQILADSTRMRYEENRGAQIQFPDNGYKGDYIKYIAKQMEEQKRDDFNIYPKQYILDWIRKDLEEFGVHFDNWFSESALFEKQKVEQVLDWLKSKNCLKEKDGALWFAGQSADPEEELDKDRVLKKSDGRTTYFTSDIAYHKDKFERGFNHCIDIWGHDHHGYVPRVESAVSLLGLPKDFLKILLYQLVSLKRDGKKVAMSTRSGEFVTLKEILDEVGRDACRFFFAMRSPNSQLEFDVDLAKKQSNENPVYYVQYVHARICSIFREAEKRGVGGVPASPAGRHSPQSTVNSQRIEAQKPQMGKIILKEKEERDLVKKLLFFDDILEGCVQIDSPHLLAAYLMDCAAKFHKFYDKCRVLDAEPELMKSRFIILRAVQNVIAAGLSLLGVSAPEKM